MIQIITWKGQRYKVEYVPMDSQGRIYRPFKVTLLEDLDNNQVSKMIADNTNKGGRDHD